MDIGKGFVIFVVLLALPGVSALTLNDNVELFYSFDNGSVNNTHVVDSAQGHHGVRMGTTEQETGIQLDSLGLHSGFVVVPAFDFGESFSICVAYRLELFEQAIVSTYGEGFSRDGGAFELFINNYDNDNPQLGVILDNGDSFVEIDTLNSNHANSSAWRFDCVTYDGGTGSSAFALFNDGALAGGISSLSSGIYPGGMNTSRDLVIGAGNPAGDHMALDTDFDFLIMYKNRTLNETEVGDIYSRYLNNEIYPFN